MKVDTDVKERLLNSFFTKNSKWPGLFAGYTHQLVIYKIQLNALLKKSTLHSQSLENNFLIVKNWTVCDWKHTGYCEGHVHPFEINNRDSPFWFLTPLCEYHEDRMRTTASAKIVQISIDEAKSLEVLRA